ncbi:partial Type I secretion system membrane fusion protein PrsE, partial [Rhodocyclaceae bacterium]
MPAPENIPKGTAGMMGTVFRWLVRKPSQKADASVNPLEDPRSAIAFGNTIIFIGIGSFLFWASLAPLDEGVPSTGVVVVESQRKIVAHLTGGIVAEVKVRENQQVREGDVLLTLDATRAQTAYTSTLNEYIAAAAKLARLTAEQTFADRIVFPEDVLAYAREAGRMDLIQAQEQVFRIRRQALTNEQAILHENLSASQSQASGARQQMAARQQQVALLTDELSRLRPLVDEGYAPRTKLFEQERQIAELTSVTSDIQARIAKEVSTSAELRLRILQRRQEFLREVESLVADASRETANLREKLRDAALELDRTTIQAPVSGQVVALQVTTPG